MKRKAAVAALAVVAMAAGVVLPRTFEQPAAAAQAPAPKARPAAPAAGRAGDRRHRCRGRRAGRAGSDRHGPALQHGHGEKPGRRPDRRRRVHRRPGGQGRHGAVPDRPAPLPGGARAGQAAKEKDEAQLATAQADLAALARSWRTATSAADLRSGEGAGRAIAGRDQRRRGADRHRAAEPGYADDPAPIDGRLGARLVDAGNMVRATDAAALVTIAQISRSSSTSRCRRKTCTRSARSRRRRRWSCGPSAGTTRRCSRGQADPDRQCDRPGDRHDPTQGDLRQ